MDDDLEALAAQRIGTTIGGKWRIERVLGVGGMASVFLATEPNGSRAALKVLHPDLNDNLELKRRFLREGPIGNALAAAAESCPGLVRVYASGETQDGVAYLAMEALEGETLFDRFVKRGKLTVLETLALAEQVLDTLVVAHDCSVVHRDLKPENIFLPVSGGVKVLDFGIARLLDDLPPSSGILDKTATRTGVIMGTGAYMAPEQATGLVKEIDGRTDLFALGATMFLLLAGRSVHGDLSDTQELIAAATQKPPPLASVAGGVPADVCAVVDRALSFIKHDRYPDARTMRGDVRALRANHPPPYARAVAEGRILPGAPLADAMGPPSSVAASSRRPGDAPPRSQVSPTIIEPVAPSRVTQTAPDSPGPTQVDAAPAKLSKAVIAIGIAALVVGIAVGVGVMTCTGSSDEARPTSGGDAGGPVPSFHHPIAPRPKSP